MLHKQSECIVSIRKILKGVESTGLTTSPRGVYIIPESDLYRLIIKSKLPGAEKFERWVMEEVLPTIRKTGRFDVKAPKTDKARALFFAQQFIEESARNERLTHENVKLSAEKARMSEIIEEAQPRLDAHGEFIDAGNVFPAQWGQTLWPGSQSVQQDPAALRVPDGQQPASIG